MKNRSTFHQYFTAVLGISFLWSLVAGVAGERVLFSNSNSKIRLPKEELKNVPVNPDASVFDKSHSSVDGVMATWQNPMNSQSRLNSKRRLLKALDKQKNWMLQDPEDLLSSGDLSSDIDLNEFEFSSNRSRGFQSTEKTAFASYYDKRERRSRTGSQRNRKSDTNYSDGKNLDGEMEDDQEKRAQDSFATPKYYQGRLTNIFDEPAKVTGNQNVSTTTENLVNAQMASSQLEGLSDPFVELGIRAQAQQAPSTDFEKLLNTTVMDMTSAGQSATALSGFDSAATTGFGASRIQSSISDGFGQSIGSSIASPSALGDAFSGSAFESATSSRSSGLFNNSTVRQSIKNRPAVFELPTRSF